jgi:hypothetical protein
MLIQKTTLQKFNVLMRLTLTLVAGLLLSRGGVYAQTDDATKAAQSRVQLGSETAKAGFRNEDDVRNRFNNWQVDPHARAWLEAMHYSLRDILSVSASKPRGGKADVRVTIRTSSKERTERISIKLVSSQNGFNQIDKRWLATYAAMWDMPPDVVQALKLFVGELPPHEGSRDPRRMYLSELDQSARQAVLDFFDARKANIVADLLVGDGQQATDWMMVTWKTGDTPRWIIRSAADAVRFFGDGPVELTRYGNLKIGRITMQRKGGDNGRDTARMLQFKINPVLLFTAEQNPD